MRGFALSLAICAILFFRLAAPARPETRSAAAQDPGATRLQLRVRDSDTAVKTLTAAGGEVVTTGWKRQPDRYARLASRDRPGGEQSVSGNLRARPTTVKI